MKKFSTQLIVLLVFCASIASGAVPLINIGTAPGDHTGDTLRDAFIKVNQAITTVNNSGAAAGVSAPDYGAVGDGVTDDSDAILSAIASGKNVSLVRGATYLISKTLQLQDGQVLNANGAKIKRLAQYHTTTTTTIVANNCTQLVVADASGFQPGQSIIVEKAGTFDIDNRVISNIVGNTIYLTTNIAVSLSGTTNVYLSYDLIKLGNKSKVLNLEIDGNKANYTFSRWQVTTEIYGFQKDDTTIDGCNIHDVPGEAILMSGNYPSVTNNLISDVGGNGIHLSNATFALISGNAVLNCNLDTTVNHVMGAIGFSNIVAHTTIVNNYLKNARSGVGMVDSTDNSDVTISGNTISNMTSFAIDGATYAGQSVGTFVITGNRIYNSLSVYLSQSGSSETTGVNRVTFSGNYLKNTKIDIIRGQAVNISGNVIDNTGVTTYHSIVVSGENTNNISINGNTIYGGASGIDLNTNLPTEPHILIENNILANQYSQGINVDNTAGRGLLIQGNSIRNDSTSLSTYYGIITNGGGIIRGNTIVITKGNDGIYAGSNTIIENNLVSTVGVGSSIRTAVASTGCIIRFNQCDKTINNAGGSGNHTFYNGVIGSFPTIDSGIIIDSGNGVTINGAVGRPKSLSTSFSASPSDELNIISNGLTGGWEGQINLKASYNAGSLVRGLSVTAKSGGTTATEVYGKFRLSGIPTYADNAAAITGGLAVGDCYRTATGVQMIRY